MEHGHLEKGCDLLGTIKIGKDANPQRAMFSRLGGLATLEWSPLSLSLSLFLSLSLSLFSRVCIRAPPPCTPFYFLCSLFVPFTRNIYFTFFVPCCATPLECWQCLVYFPTLCDSIVHDICISTSACIRMIVHFV